MEIKCKIEICLLLEELQKFCTQLKKKPRIKNKSWSWRFLSCTWQSETERQWESETERQWQANRKKKKGECQYETRPLPHPYSWAVTQMPPRRTWINLKLIGIPSVTWSTVCARYAKCNAQQGRKMKRSLTRTQDPALFYSFQCGKKYSSLNISATCSFCLKSGPVCVKYLSMKRRKRF